MGGSPTSEAWLVTGGNPPSVLREASRGDVLRKTLLTFFFLSFWPSPSGFITGGLNLAQSGYSEVFFALKEIKAVVSNGQIKGKSKIKTHIFFQLFV